MAQSIFETPIGPLYIDASDLGIRLLSFLDGSRHAGLLDHLDPIETPQSDAEAIIDETQRQLDAYFEGNLREFDLPLDLKGTPFQKRAWAAIAAVSFGETVSYSDIAESIGAPNAYRAAGTACGANPVVIIVPCHRIVGRDKGLHGFGGGLETKRWLLSHEGSLAGIKADGWANKPPQRLPVFI